MKAKLLGVLVVLALLLGGGAAAFVTLSDDGTGEGRPVAFKISPEQPLAGETATISGRLGPVGRSIALLREEAGEWVTLNEGPAGAGGKFSFEVPVTDGPRTYRVEAATMRVGEQEVRLRRSTDIVLGGVTPSVSLTLGAPIGQSRDGSDALTTAEAAVTPAREGAEIVVERNRDGRWTELAAGEQDEGGRFSFVLPAAAAEDPASLRAATTLPGGKPIYSDVAAASSVELVWRDEFDGTKMADHWFTARAITSLRPCTSTSPDTAQVRGGVARISVLRDLSKPRSEECPKGWWFNAQFTTEKSQLFKYGTFAARIKMQPEQGMHGGWFLYNLPETDPGVPPDQKNARGIEIDAVEYYGDDDDKGGFKAPVQNSIYYPVLSDENPRGYTIEKKGGRMDVSAFLGEGEVASDDFHVYSVEWTPESIVFRFDGNETFRVDDVNSTREHYLFLSMLTSPFETQFLQNDELPATMEVDWVRVWQETGSSN